MGTIADFYKLRDTEDFFKFFDIDFDQKLINVKRFHMMKEYGTLIKKGMKAKKVTTSHGRGPQFKNVKPLSKKPPRKVITRI